MLIEDQLRERLKKVEALYFGATTAGERDAAEAAAERLKAKLEEACRRDPPDRDEVQFAGPMVGPIVHRLVPALWHSAVPISAAALNDDHGQGATPLLRHSGVAAVF